jgi:hypothetical protein
MSRRAPVGMLANLGGRLCDVCHGVLHGSAISALAAIFRVVIRPEITGNAGKWRETVRKRRSMTRVIALVAAAARPRVRERSTQARTQRRWRDQSGLQTRTRPWLRPTRRPIVARRRRAEGAAGPSGTDPKRKKRCGHDKDVLRDHWPLLASGRKLGGGSSKDGSAWRRFLKGNEALPFDRVGSRILSLVVLLAHCVTVIAGGTPILGAPMRTQVRTRRKRDERPSDPSRAAASALSTFAAPGRKGRARGSVYATAPAPCGYRGGAPSP